jgi:C4-dicarboxylate-binding protein DctP
VDGAIRAPDDAWSFGERDIYKSMIATPAQLSLGWAYIATRAWDKLPPDVQQFLSAVSVEFDPQVLKYFFESDQKSIENLKAKGMRIVEIGPADKKRLADARMLYWEDIVSKSPSAGPRLRAMLEPYSR